MGWIRFKGVKPCKPSLRGSHELVMLMRKKGKTLLEIGGCFGVTKQAVHSYLKYHARDNDNA